MTCALHSLCDPPHARLLVYLVVGMASTAQRPSASALALKQAWAYRCRHETRAQQTCGCQRQSRKVRSEFRVGIQASCCSQCANKHSARAPVHVWGVGVPAHMEVACATRSIGKLRISCYGRVCSRPEAETELSCSREAAQLTAGACTYVMEGSRSFCELLVFKFSSAASSDVTTAATSPRQSEENLRYCTLSRSTLCWCSKQSLLGWKARCLPFAMRAASGR